MSKEKGNNQTQHPRDQVQQEAKEVTETPPPTAAAPRAPDDNDDDDDGDNRGRKGRRDKRPASKGRRDKRPAQEEWLETDDEDADFRRLSGIMSRAIGKKLPESRGPTFRIRTCQTPGRPGLA